MGEQQSHRGCTLGVQLTAVLLVIAGNASATQTTSDWNYSIEEERPNGTVVGNIKRDLGLESKYPANIARDLRFQFLTTPRTNLHIDSVTGVISTSGRIDREAICALQHLCNVELDIAVQPVTVLQIIKISLEIKDINDNYPTFPEMQFTYQILESNSPGYSFIISGAVDPDGPRFGIKGYRLIPDSNTFEVKKNPKLDGSNEVRIYLRDRLDREVRGQYLFQLLAYDGDNPPKTGSLDLDIEVTDVNDNSPTFENSTYTVSVLENLALQTTIIQVRATDRDQSLNGKVLYGFSSHTAQMYGHIFGIRNRTGDIFVKGDVDHEKRSAYHLVVTAQDGGQDALTSDATVIIEVRDINDHAPVMTVNTLTNTGEADTAEVPEDVAVGTFVAHISVQDEDSGLNGQVNCALHDKHFLLKQIDNNEPEFQIVTAASLDREDISQFNLELVCRDRGSIQQMSIKNILVKVLDINDNQPIFLRGTYALRMKENNKDGDLILQVKALDADTGRNGQIGYKLPKSIRDLFFINNRGAIFAHSVIDREQFQTNDIAFDVIAEDRGSPQKTGTAKIVITLQDVNDEAPVFAKTLYSFTVHENESAGRLLGTLTATDRDQYPNNEFTYSFQPGPNRYDDKFGIDRFSGEVTCLQSLDRDEGGLSYYSLVAMATDSRDPRLVGTADVMIAVTDENDNWPIFSFPSANNNTVHISNKHPVGKTIIKVTAFDIDDSDNGNGRVTYQLIRGNFRNTFAFNNKTGEIKLYLDLSQVKYREYDLHIEASDQGSPPKMTPTTLKIVVNDSIVYYVPEAHTSVLTATNFIIIIIIGSISFVVVCFLVAAIVVVKVCQRQDRHKRRTCVNSGESMKMLHTRDTVSTFADSLSPHHLMPGSPSSSCSDRQALDIEDSELDGSPKRWGRPPGGWQESPVEPTAVPEVSL